MPAIPYTFGTSKPIGKAKVGIKPYIDIPFKTLLILKILDFVKICVPFLGSH